MSRILVKRTKIDREDGFIYFINDDGNICSIKEISNPGKNLKVNIVSKSRIKKKPGFAYFLDENGNICKIKLLKVKLNNISNKKSSNKK